MMSISLTDRVCNDLGLLNERTLGVTVFACHLYTESDEYARKKTPINSIV